MMRTAARLALHTSTNIAIRALTLASKFILIVYLAKVLSPEQVGTYGLFITAISYTLYLLGLDFYTYAQREMFSSPQLKWGEIIHNQFVFYGAVYLILFPILLIAFAIRWLPWNMLGWFYLILTLEHLSQELCRLLVVCGKVTLANVTLFFRGGAWVFFVVLFFCLKPEMRHLSAIWAGWSVGDAISITIAILGVRSTIGPQVKQRITDWGWVRRGLKVAAQFLIGTLALRGLFTFDRYFLDLYAGKSAVGVYSFFMSIANALLAFADAGVISRLYPKLVTAYRNGEINEYKVHLKKLAVGIVGLNAVFVLGLSVAIHPILGYIGKDVYVRQLATLWVLLAAIMVYCLGLVPHYALYARNCDRAIAIASCVSIAVFFAVARHSAPTGGPTSMAFAVLVALFCLGAIKACIWKYKTSREKAATAGPAVTGDVA